MSDTPDCQATPRHDSCMMARSGMMVDLLDPRPSQINPFDIAVSLARIPRYNGHTIRRYSVAEHLVFASEFASQDNMPRAVVQHVLMHDFAEAYTGDIISPIKRLLGDQIHLLESALLRAIYLSAGLTGPSTEERAIVRRYDRGMLACEVGQLRVDPWVVESDLPPARPVVLPCWREKRAKKELLRQMLRFGLWADVIGKHDLLHEALG